MKDIRQSSNYAKYMRKMGWTVEKVGSIYCYIKKIPILGAIVKVQRPTSLTTQEVKKIEGLRGKYRIFQVVIEPNNKTQVGTVTSRGYQLTKNPFLPSKTLILKLNKSKKELFNDLKKDTRYSINKANHNLKDPAVYNLTAKSFHEIMKKAVSWQRHVPSVKALKALKDSFAHHTLFIASHNSSTGAIFLLNNKTAYYWQAFTNMAARASLLQYRLVWEGILWAKTNGAQYFDFEGIYDKRFPNKSWLGFTKFKKKFGGIPTPYPGAYRKIFWGVIFTKTVIFALLLGVFVLSFTALDDITTGQEPNFFLEYTTLVFSVIIILALIFFKIKKDLIIPFIASLVLITLAYLLGTRSDNISPPLIFIGATLPFVIFIPVKLIKLSKSKVG